MKQKTPLPDEKKLVVVCRVEAGCLGSKGADHIDAFCEFAQKEYVEIDADYITWLVVPRNDKSQPEMQYRVNNKKISRDQFETAIFSIFYKFFTIKGNVIE